MNQADDLTARAAHWWNSINYYDKKYYVKLYEGGTVPVVSLTDGAIIRLYLKVADKLTNSQALEKYHQIFKK